MAAESEIVRVLCSKRVLVGSSKAPGLRWLIGSPRFLPPLTVVSSLACLHVLPDDLYSPDFNREADDIQALLIKGFNIVGALFVGNGNGKENAIKAVEASHRMRKTLFNDGGSYKMIGAAADMITRDVDFFVSEVVESRSIETSTAVVYGDNSENYVWEIGCLLRCELEFKLPVYFSVNNTSDVVEKFSSLTDAAAAKFRDPQLSYIVEGTNVTSEEVTRPIVLHGAELDFNSILSDQMPSKASTKGSEEGALLCSNFCSENKLSSSFRTRESADTIRVSVLSNQSRNKTKSAAPVAEYFPALDSSRNVVVSFKLDVLCYASKDFPVAAAISELVIPGLVDQLFAMKRAIIPKLLKQHPQLSVFHFLPPGILHPVTIIYDLRYGESEYEQVEHRKALHLRLGLPLDRPLLRLANALTFNLKNSRGSNSIRKETPLLRDVHTEIPSSGVSGGIISIIDGSYEYYHYLLNGFDDNGWGCAYRSLQTIMSWFRLHHYTTSDVPSHRDIQQALVDIGDKEPSFVGSREWIGAIELSFVLDKLLGVSCKIMNVRSGSELPEKCRELALHFETQGTPVMIGGGVLAYTLLGVDYNEVNGDCAFLILDPHYTGNDDLKKIVSGGWCGWKKAVDSRGRNFFLHDKFYNLLLPQRPNMV